MSSAIIFENVSREFPGGFVGLRDINLTIQEGEFVSIIGQSGAGKSTLLRMIYAEDFPTEGRVLFFDRATEDIETHLLPFYRRNFGNVFQDFKLLENKTVFENVAFALEVDGRETEDIEEAVPKILTVVRLDGKEDLYPKHLSGGERQRVSLARALVHEPKMIIADEPTGNLDEHSTRDILDLLLKINEFGTTVLLATHDKGIVDKVHRRVITLKDGEVIRDEIKGRYML